MASYNRIIMMGNLTRDPEVKQLNSGQSVCRFGLASNRQFKNRQTGTMVQEVCFVDIDVWGPQAEICKQYLQKGRGVLVEGRLKLDSWQDQDGTKKSKHSIVADRVTFLAGAASQDDVDVSDMSSETVMPAKTEAAEMKEHRRAKPATGQTTAGSGEVVLKDEAPFEDDLPF
ncbi:MAG: Single-stranded DNA-binding protein [candidate division TM6 bacterium GW2011_GWF2_37_49]|nr:MAG: Single-stranded DNA-binding protein [candidate division TM6 bacterium GW2011_GWF2_37_49]